MVSVPALDAFSGVLKTMSGHNNGHSDVERWLPVAGYEDLYEVSTEGRVRSLRSGKIRRDVDNGRGYRKVALSRDGKDRDMYIHRLVAIAFIPNPDDLPQVHHKDFVKHNNRAKNLEWVTAKKNVCESRDLDGAMHAITNPNNAKKLTAEQVAEMRSRDWSGHSYEEIAALYGVSPSMVNNVLRAKAWNDPFNPIAPHHKLAKVFRFIHMGKMSSFAEIATESGISEVTIRFRYARGERNEKLVREPVKQGTMTEDLLGLIVSLLPLRTNKEIHEKIGGEVSRELISHIRCGRAYSKQTGITAKNRQMLRRPPKTGPRAENPPRPDMEVAA